MAKTVYILTENSVTRGVFSSVTKVENYVLSGWGIEALSDDDRRELHALRKSQTERVILHGSDYQDGKELFRDYVVVRTELQ